MSSTWAVVDSNHRVGYLLYRQARSAKLLQLPWRGKKIRWSGRDDLTTEGRTGFEPVSNGFTDRFLSHLDHVPVDQAGLEPTTPGL